MESNRKCRLAGGNLVVKLNGVDHEDVFERAPRPRTFFFIPPLRKGAILEARDIKDTMKDIQANIQSINQSANHRSK